MKNEKSIHTEKVVLYHQNGYNCAQSVMLTMQEYWKEENPLKPKVASAFGGGIGRSGSVCGALTGGVIAIGSKFGSNKPGSEEREKAYLLGQKFYNQFKKECGSVFCRDLIGYDLTNPKELEEARKANIFQEKCVHFLKKSVQILMDLK